MEVDLPMLNQAKDRRSREILRGAGIGTVLFPDYYLEILVFCRLAVATISADFWLTVEKRWDT